jgi:acyl-CoA thioesterase
VGTSQFARSTSVTPIGNGRYTGDVGPEWNCPIVPQGGMIVAIAARAMGAELGGELPLRSISVVFAAPVQPGPVEIDVQVIRKGRSMSQCLATVHNPGSEIGTTAIAVFGGVRPGFEFTGTAPPVVPRVDDCPSFRDPVPDDIDFEFDHEPFPFWQNIEGKPAIGTPPWEDSAGNEPLRAIYNRFEEDVRLDDGRWDPLALVALADTMPGGVFEHLGRVSDGWAPPSADCTVHVVGDVRSEWALCVSRARKAYDGYASIDIEIWDVEPEVPVLAVYGTQVMFFAQPR